MSGHHDLGALRQALDAGGVVVLPTDTVYGLAAALDAPEGVDALYRLKGRARDVPIQVLLLGDRAREKALDALPEPVRAAAEAMLPGPVTCLAPDPEGRYAAAAGREEGSVGLRAPRVVGELAGYEALLVATSANERGGPDPASVEDVPTRLRRGAALVWDGGHLPGTASAIVDLRPVERSEPAVLIRPGHDVEAVRAALAGAGVALL